MVSVMLTTISSNDEAEKFRNNLRSQPTSKTSTNSPQGLLDKLIYTFSIMDRNSVGLTNRD